MSNPQAAWEAKAHQERLDYIKKLEKELDEARKNASSIKRETARRCLEIMYDNDIDQADAVMRKEFDI